MLNKEKKVQPTSKSGNDAKPFVTRPFAFGEWVLIDGAKSGQIVDFYGNGWYMVDFAGVWERYKDDRITKDERYRSANGV